eukprot:3244444-Amphidinium_carterae.4
MIQGNSGTLKSEPGLPSFPIPSCTGPVVANLSAAEHEPHEPSADWFHWELVANAVRNFWVLVGPKLRERLGAWPCVRLPTPVIEPDPPVELPAEVLPRAPHEVGPHERVVEYNGFARCLVCYRQTGKVKGKFSYSCLKRQECRLLCKILKQRVDSAAKVEPPASQVEPETGVG